MRPAYARGNKRPGVMNRTEGKYASVLEQRLRGGEIAWYAYEGVKLRLADKTFYTPDFFVMHADGTLECHEVKGFMTNEANVKVKCAAEKFPFRFFVIRFIKREWEVEEV